jgi:hypothetical protein
MSFSSCVSPDPTYKGETAILGKIQKGGAPYPGAYIRLLDSGKDFVGEVKSDEAGKFQFFAGPGEWFLVCLAPGSDRQEQPVSLSKGDELQVEFAL